MKHLRWSVLLPERTFLDVWQGSKYASDNDNKNLIYSWKMYIYIYNIYNVLTRKRKRKTKLKDTHRKEAPSNKTPALTKSSDMGIWVVGTSNQLFIRGY